MRARATVLAGLGLAIGCGGGGAEQRDTGVAEDAYETGTTADSLGAGLSGTGTTGAQANTSGDVRGEMGGTRPLDAPAIVTALADVNRSAIRDARLALKHTGSDAIREFARMVERDHAAALRAVEQHVASHDPAPVPDQATVPELAGKQGAELDTAYLARAVRVHEEAIRSLEERFLPAADDAALRALIEDMLPTLHRHLASARRLQAR